MANENCKKKKAIRRVSKENHLGIQRMGRNVLKKFPPKRLLVASGGNHGLEEPTESWRQPWEVWT